MPRARGASAIEGKPIAGSWLRSVEEAWLGLRTPTFGDRARDVGWMADAPSAYCERCGVTVGPHESRADEEGNVSCPECRGKRPKFSCVVRLGEFDGLIRDAVHEIKFSAWRRLGDEVGRLLGERLGEALDRAGVAREAVVIVPMAMTVRRRLARGIDHATVLARGVRAVLGAPIVHAVVREHRPSQVSVPHSQRRDNVSRTMRLRRGVDVFGRLVVIVDDVMTTGATMGECARAIREGSRGEQLAPLDVWAAVVGVAARERRGGGIGEGQGV